MKICPRCKARYDGSPSRCPLDGSALSALVDARLGATIAGRYLLEEAIGEGGMAIVYRARHVLLDARFAVKVMRPVLARDRIVRERFRREAASARRIAHPNIIEIVEEGDTSDGTAYLVMELLEGSVLSRVMANGPVPIERALPLLIQMARGIARAHDLGVIHRDLKPENIFVCTPAGAQKERIKLLDFGIALSRQDARLTGNGELFGTPQYMAPERIAAGDSGASSDLYALGVIAFEMIAGRLPFACKDAASFFVAHIKETPPSLQSLCPGLPRELGALVDSLLDKAPAKRPADAHRVAVELAQVAAAIGVDIPDDAPIEPPSVRASTSGPVARGAGAWLRRAAAVRELLAAAYGDATPDAPAQLVAELETDALRASELHERWVALHTEVDAIVQSGREVRARLGFAADALGIDASRAREALRSIEQEHRSRVDRAAAHADALRACVKEIALWEGRSGMQEPSPELEEAYRAAADVVSEWLERKRIASDVADRAAHARSHLADLEFQITEVRDSLARHEAEIDERRSARDRELLSLAADLATLDAHLVDLATRLTDPLRGRADLEAAFARVEAA